MVNKEWIKVFPSFSQDKQVSFDTSYNSVSNKPSLRDGLALVGVAYSDGRVSSFGMWWRSRHHDWECFQLWHYSRVDRGSKKKGLPSNWDWFTVLQQSGMSGVSVWIAFLPEAKNKLRFSLSLFSSVYVDTVHVMWMIHKSFVWVWHICRVERNGNYDTCEWCSSRWARSAKSW